MKFMDPIAETWTGAWLSKQNQTQVQKTSQDGEIRQAVGQKWTI